jgi:hypothetical protein
MVQPAASRKHRVNMNMISTHFPEHALARTRGLLGHKRHRRQPRLAWYAGVRAEEILVGLGTYVHWTVGVQSAVRNGEVGVAAAASGRGYMASALGASVRQSS